MERSNRGGIPLLVEDLLKHGNDFIEVLVDQPKFDAMIDLGWIGVECRIFNAGRVSFSEGDVYVRARLSSDKRVELKDVA